MNEAELKERLEVLRRIAERGLAMAQRESSKPSLKLATYWTSWAHRQHLDLWQHMLDELERIK